MTNNPGERWSKQFSYKGRKFEAEFRRRPFREGLEVSVVVDGHTLRCAELGLGERAILEKLKAQIDKLLISQE